MKKGQSLFEVIISIGIAALILTAIVAASTLSVRNTTSSRDNTQANRYVQEATEWLRSQRDADWLTFQAKAGLGGTVYCMNSLSFSSPGNCTAGSVIANTIFTRESTLSLTTTNVAGDTVEVLTAVSWQDSQGAHDVSVSTRFTDWMSQVN